VGTSKKGLAYLHDNTKYINMSQILWIELHSCNL